MRRTHRANIELIKTVASRLGPLLDKVVFLGGAATGLLITDAAAPDVRPTLDVDVIVEISSRMDYYRLEESLRKLGFKPDQEEGAPICRWIVDRTKVDVMPTDEKILGFTNRWYSPAIKGATEMELPGGMTILMVTAPYFLATKIEAFYGRGNGDCMASHDMEDIIALLDGRPEIIDEIRSSPSELRGYLAETFQAFLKDEKFLESLPGHLPPDLASQRRVSIVRARIEGICVMD